MSDFKSRPNPGDHIGDLQKRVLSMMSEIKSEYPDREETRLIVQYLSKATEELNHIRNKVVKGLVPVENV